MDPIQTIYDKTSIALEYQNALGYAIPPFIPFRQIVRVTDADSIEANPDLKNRLQSGLSAIAAVNYQVPVGLSLKNDEGEIFMLPVDPIISVSGKNIITRRYVAKSTKAGTIKERFAQDDWELTISGLLTNDSRYTANEYTKILSKLCTEGRQGLIIQCDLLNTYMDINWIVVEDFQFPFTKGVENQNFVIKAYSDSDYDLLIK